ncbi:MAG: hypothetical protein WAU78_10120 [Roseiarcus sp.]
MFPLVSSPRGQPRALGGGHRQKERADNLEKRRFVKEKAGNPLIFRESAKGKAMYHLPHPTRWVLCPWR